mgnify:CR=1 FL=1
MTDHTVPPWWAGVPERVERLARSMCERHLPSGTMVLPYQAPQHAVPNAIITVVAMESLMPLWACYVSAAKDALDIAERQLIAEAAGLTSDEPVSRETQPSWRREIGLDEQAP